MRFCHESENDSSDPYEEKNYCTKICTVLLEKELHQHSQKAENEEEEEEETQVKDREKENYNLHERRVLSITAHHQQ